jgi:hypothetical protein
MNLWRVALPIRGSFTFPKCSLILSTGLSSIAVLAPYSNFLITVSDAITLAPEPVPAGSIYIGWSSMVGFIVLSR